MVSTAYVVLNVVKLVFSYFFSISFADKKVSTFADGTLPGEDWARSFLRRYKKEISLRWARNITVNRYSVTDEAINSYFDHLSEAVANIPPENIFNYDETNVTDDPGCKRALFSRG